MIYMHYCDVFVDLCVLCINNRTMELQYIREFIHLADTRSYSRSAAELHISQSSLSRHIQLLEKELGELLFMRSTRSVTLTDFGQIYLPCAKKIIAADDSAVRTVSRYLKTKTETVILGVSHNPQLYLVTDSIRSFRSAHPDIPVRITEGSIQELQNELEDGTLHLATTAYSRREHAKNAFIPAGESSLVAVIPENHFLASYDTVPLYRLNGIHLMVPAKDTLFYRELSYWLKRDGIVPDIVYQGSVGGSISLLKDGMGIMIEDRKSAFDTQSEGTVIRPLSPEISYTFGLEYTNHLSRNEQIFVSHIRNLLSKKDVQNI